MITKTDIWSVMTAVIQDLPSGVEVKSLEIVHNPYHSRQNIVVRKDIVQNEIGFLRVSFNRSMVTPGMELRVLDQRTYTMVKSPTEDEAVKGLGALFG